MKFVNRKIFVATDPVRVKTPLSATNPSSTHVFPLLTTKNNLRIDYSVSFFDIQFVYALYRKRG
jgi:hypothetical protein